MADVEHATGRGRFWARGPHLEGLGTAGLGLGDSPPMVPTGGRAKQGAGPAAHDAVVVCDRISSSSHRQKRGRSFSVGPRSNE